MQRVESKISDSDFQRIKEHGKSVYQFTGEAIAEKLMREDVKTILKEYENDMKQKEIEFDEKIEKAILKCTEIQARASEKIDNRVEEALKKYVSRNEEFNHLLAIVRQHLEELMKR